MYSEPPKLVFRRFAFYQAATSGKSNRLNAPVLKDKTWIHGGIQPAPASRGASRANSTPEMRPIVKHLHVLALLARYLVGLTCFLFQVSILEQ
jgi:hypothetical protein